MKTEVLKGHVWCAQAYLYLRHEIPSGASDLCILNGPPAVFVGRTEYTCLLSVRAASFADARAELLRMFLDIRA